MKFNSLFVALEPWFESLLDDIPEDVRARIEREFFPGWWDELEPVQRREAIRQLDAQHDPDAEMEGIYWFDLFNQIRDLKKQMETWSTAPASGVEELDRKELRLRELEEELRVLEARARVGKKFYSAPSNRFEVISWDQFISFPMAMSILKDRLGATVDEIAIWARFGSRKGGIDAFKKQDQEFPPSRFFFHPELSHQYLNHLTGCWFIKEEINTFDPEERFITGAELVRRWQGKLGDGCRSFIADKIKELRLIDLHPVKGGTQASEPDDPELPTLEEGIFPLDLIQEVEEQQLNFASSVEDAKVGSKEWRSQNARNAANARHDKPGGSREKGDRIREIWASGKYTSRDICAEQECAALDMSFSAARKALRNTPDPIV